MANFFVEATSPVLIEDLKRWVTPTAPIWVTRKEYGGSICLSSLEKMGKLRVTCKNRSVEERVSKPPKSPPPPFMALSRPRPGVPPKPQPPQQITMEEAQNLAARAAQEAADKALAGLVDRLAPPPAGGISAEQLEKALAKALAGVQISGGGRLQVTREVSAPEEPLFIPTGIVKESPEELDVQSSSTKDTTLKSAASALKALKKSRKGKE